jgi:excisionase family DNA binding protein
MGALDFDRLLMANRMSANRNPPKDQSHAILNSWKEIAGYLGRGVRTVQRWEQELHLPVHRMGKGRRSPVFAGRFGTEILNGNLGWEERL